MPFTERFTIGTLWVWIIINALGLGSCSRASNLKAREISSPRRPYIVWGNLLPTSTLPQFNQTIIIISKNFISYASFLSTSIKLLYRNTIILHKYWNKYCISYLCLLFLLLEKKIGKSKFDSKKLKENHEIITLVCASRQTVPNRVWNAKHRNNAPTQGVAIIHLIATINELVKKTQLNEKSTANVQI